MNNDQSKNNGKTTGIKADVEAAGRVKNDLLPCPFCGGQAAVRQCENRMEVVCMAVGCYAKRVCITDSREAAIRKWNERVR